jgi:hypothetical protein
MVVYLAQVIKIGGEHHSSPRKPEHHEQGAVEVLGRFAVNMADDAPNPLMAKGDRLVSHCHSGARD